MGGRLMSWSVGKRDLTPMQQLVLTAMCRIADDTHGRFWKNVHAFLAEDVPSVASHGALRLHYAALGQLGYIGRIRKGRGRGSRRSSQTEYQMLAAGVLSMRALTEFEEIERRRPRRRSPLQSRMTVLNLEHSAAPQDVSSSIQDVSSDSRPDIQDVSSDSRPDIQDVSSDSRPDIQDVISDSRPDVDTLLGNTKKERNAQTTNPQTATSKRRSGGSSPESSSLFSSELLASLEAHGVFGFTVPSLAFVDDHLSEFVRIRGAPPSQNDVDYLAERARDFVARGIDDSFRVQEYMKTVITQSLKTGTTRITLGPPKAAAAATAERMESPPDITGPLDALGYEMVDGKIRQKAG